MDDEAREQERPRGAPQPAALDAEDLEDVEAHDADTAHELAVAEPDGDPEETSLEELLAQRAARRAARDSDEESDIMSLTTRRDTAGGPSRHRAARARDREEFVCTCCHLVKPKVQLTDPARRLCRDCA